MAALGALTWHILAARMLGLPLRTMGAVVGRSIAAAAVMAAVVITVMRAPDAHWLTSRPILGLIVLVGCGAAIHIVTQAALWRAAGLPAGPETQALSQARGLWNRVASIAGLPQFR